MLWTWIPTKPREKGPLFKITMGCPVGLWVITELATTCWMPFSPPDTILEVSDQYQTRLILPNPQVEITLTVFYSLTEAQKDDVTCPAVCDPREADFRVHASVLYEVGSAIGTRWLSLTSVPSLSSLWQKGASFCLLWGSRWDEHVTIITLK